MIDITPQEATERESAVRKILSKKALSRADAARINELGCCALVYPRKGIVVVNGFRRYELRK